MGKVEFLNNAVNPLKIHYEQLVTRFDPEHGISWVEMKPEGVPCCTPALLSELNRYNKSIENCGGKVLVGQELHPVNYSVVGSLIPKVFNLGGNLELFSKLIKTKDRDALLAYATLCIDVVHSRVSHYNLPLITISLVQGDALGGGFEAALSSDVIIAERRAKLGFPEILFNLFPGMGAYSFLARKVGGAQAEKIILSGKLYDAAELHEIGIVDVLVEDGLGEVAVYDYIEKQSRRSNGYMALQKARQRFSPVTYQELHDITSIWVDAAMKLSEKDMKVMDRFVRSQHRLNTSVLSDSQNGKRVDLVA